MGSLVSGLARAVNDVPLCPMPPLAEYEAWLQARKDALERGGRLIVSASCYRRIAQLRRQHDSWAEINRCVGLRGCASAKRCWLRLPEELR